MYVYIYVKSKLRISYILRILEGLLLVYRQILAMYIDKATSLKLMTLSIQGSGIRMPN